MAKVESKIAVQMFCLGGQQIDDEEPITRPHSAPLRNAKQILSQDLLYHTQMFAEINVPSQTRPHFRCQRQNQFMTHIVCIIQYDSYCMSHQMYRTRCARFFTGFSCVMERLSAFFVRFVRQICCLDSFSGE